jgi:hypothetical protein
MIRYAARAVPWSVVLAACVATPILLAIVATWMRLTWPLQGIAIGLLAATAAWCMDEAAASVVDTLPRSLRWRTAARALALAPLLATWTACILVAGDRLPPHQHLFLLQGAAALAAATAFATWRRARGRATPGLAMGAAILPCATALALLRPFDETLPVFPVWPGEDWTRSTLLWGALATSAVVLLASTLRGRGGRQRA